MTETLLTLQIALALCALGPFLTIIYLEPKEGKKKLSRLWLKLEAMSNHIHVQAGRGSGKSRLLGRIIAWFNFAVLGMPQVVIDPWGTTIDNFLDKLARLPRKQQEQLWPRVRYVDMSGKGGYVCPFPLYYRLGNESLYNIALRPLMVMLKLDPSLKSASIEGWNALRRVGARAGMLLFALGLQITEAEQLLENPQAFAPHFDRLQVLYPQLGRVVPFFRELPEHKERSRLIGSFLNKIEPFSLDESTMAMFGASTPGINWQEVVDKRLTVLLDFRHELNPEMRQFKMTWALQYLIEFIKFRGTAGRANPIGLIIDELAAMASVDALNTELFAADFEEMINVLGRNMGLWITVSHQELYQFSERLQKTLMSIGTQILGKTSDPDAAEYLARNFFKFDPYWIKKHERVWMSNYAQPYIIDLRSVEFTSEEQKLLHSHKLLDLGLFQFLVRPAIAEGDVRGKLTPVSIANYDRGQFPNESLVAIAREKLMRKYGVPVPKLLSEIGARQKLPKSAVLQLADPAEKEDEQANFWVG